MKEEGLRYNEGKLRYDLVHPIAQAGLVKVLTVGAEKYEPRNWEKGMSWSSVIASLKRHLAAIEMGEDYDKESGLLHIDHLQANAHFLSAYYKIYPQGDDRNKWFKNWLKRVWLDLDGVIFDFEKHFLSYLKLPLYNPTDWDDFRFRKNFSKIIKDSKFWLTLPTLINPEDITYPITGYCTSRPCDDGLILASLEKNGFPQLELINVGNGSKSEALLGKCDVMVDDSIKNFIDLNSKGILCYLMTRPHNIKYDVGHYRVNSIKEFFDKL